MRCGEREGEAGRRDSREDNRLISFVIHQITFIFVALLFADAVNQLIKIQKEGAANRNATGAAPDAHRMNDFRSRKFLSGECERQASEL